MSGEDAGEFGLFASGGRRSIQLSYARRLFEINDLKGNKGCDVTPVRIIRNILLSVQTRGQANPVVVNPPARADAGNVPPADRRPFARRE